METKGLLFIPDISGFTRFINETEIEHSRYIIQELLEIIINANKSELQISEIEGDAILFYKFGACPDVQSLYAQVKEMFCAFHTNLLSYERRRFCQCAACMSAVHLTLKVITHYGEFTGYSVKNFNKLIGRDIIVAHQLLKNDIPQHEYWLVTKNIISEVKQPGLPDSVQWNSSARQTESGEIAFQYTPLSHLKNEIDLEPLPALDLSKKTKMISFSKEYDAHIIVLFHATGDFNYRSRWKVGVKKVEEVDHFLPRIGMRCRCILNNGHSNIYSSSYSFGPERIEFSETDEDNGNTLVYILEKIAEYKTRLTLDFYITKNIGRQAWFNLAKKKKVEEGFQKSLENLVLLSQEIKLPGI